MSFTSETKVKDIALSNPAATQILEDAGLDYCCGGGKSLHEACLHADVPAEEILNRLRENSKHVDPGEASWTLAPLGDLTRHIRERHHRYVREAIARVQPLSDKVVAKHGKNHSELAEIRTAFGVLSQELTTHMLKEDSVLFPHIVRMEESVIQKEPVLPPPFGTVRNPVAMMMHEHDVAGIALRDLRRASNGYSAPPDACISHQTLYQALAEFETDLHQHIHLENNILFPRAIEMERACS